MLSNINGGGYQWWEVGLKVIGANSLYLDMSQTFTPFEASCQYFSTLFNIIAEANLCKPFISLGILLHYSRKTSSVSPDIMMNGYTNPASLDIPICERLISLFCLLYLLPRVSY